MRRQIRITASATVLALAVSLFASIAARAGAPSGSAPALQKEKSVPGRNAKATTTQPDLMKDAITQPPTVTWPKAGAAVVALSGKTSLVTAGSLPVRVGASRQATAPSSVRVEVLDQRLDGPVLRLSRADGVAKATQVAVNVDYSGYRNAYGDDWALRLRLASLPACALTTPAKPECRVTMLPTSNDGLGHLSATADLPSSGSGVFAVTAAASGSAGDTGASPLGPSATWTGGSSSGDFSWSYPIQTPPSLGGPAPQLALSYSSGSVDGRTAATNNQPSWAGEGFDFAPGGYIERRYTGCATDTTGGNNSGHKTGDLCWRTDNASFALNGKGGELVKDDTTGAWHPRSDDGSKVERLTRPIVDGHSPNGDNDGEYWKITARDGTQYFFGLNELPGYSTTRNDPVTVSTWTAPVYGNQTGEPCHTTSFATSACYQAWRWNLDYVVDPHGNTMSYYYTSERNSYGRNLTASPASWYVRGGYLNRIDYGQRDGAVYTTKPVAQVVTNVADRCLAGSGCVPSQPANWPDTPMDQYCAETATSCTHYSPTFWTQKMLTKITTKVLKGDTLQDVNSWTLAHDFRSPGDGSRAGLWLTSVQRTGLVGGSLSLPPTTFEGVQMPNRVDGIGDGILPMNWWRVSAIHSETGGVLTVSYAGADCAAPGNLPASPDTNGKRCYPVKWTPPNATTDVTDWFNKYVVTAVSDKDMTTEGPAKEAQYTYPRPPAWRHDDEDGMVPTERKTWSQWRGYDQVQVREGHPGDVQKLTDTLYFRGMDQDLTASGGHKPVQITDTTGTSWPDTNEFAGSEREQSSFVSDGGAMLSRNINDPWLSTPTATSVHSWGTTKAYLVQQSKVVQAQAQPSGALLQTETDNSYDGQGMLQQSNDLNNVSDPNDDTCTRYTYAASTSAGILELPSRVEKVADPCTETPSYPNDVVSDERVYYDGNDTFGAAPVHGDVTRKEEIFGWANGTPIYRTTERGAYDMYGRRLESYDVFNNKSVATFAPATGAPPTKTTLTNPLGQVTSAEIEPAWGTELATIDEGGRRTDTTFDPLGRATQVWQPGRDRSSQTPTEQYSYLVRTDGPNVITTKTLQPDGTYDSNYELYDGQGRPRQTQAPAPGGGRTITDHIYDARGLEVKENGPYYNGAAPGTDVYLPDEAQLSAQTVTEYDGSGRPTAQIFKVEGVEKWRTTNSYNGYRQDIDPPTGDTPSTRILDAQGNLVELRQYKGAAPTGEYDKTTFTYTNRNQLASVTDPAGNVWRYTYDLRGRRIGVDDPDRGVSTYTYDDGDRVVTQTDSRGVTLAFEYDKLGRKIAVHEGSVTGPKRSSWTFDTLADGTSVAGLPVSSTRYLDGNAYVSTITGYDTGNRPTGVALTIPASEGKLAGTYQYTSTYTPDGQPATRTQPAMGGLPGETVSYGYNGSGLASTMSGATSYVTGTAYTPYGEPQELTLSTGGNWVKDTFEYETGTRRLSRAVIDRQTGPGRLADINYSYDDAGNVTRIADQPGTSSGQPNDVQCLSYDYLRRLTTAWTPGSGDCATGPSAAGLGGPAPYWEAWTFDSVGDRLSQTSTTPDGQTTTDTYSYPQPGAPNPHAVAQIASTGPNGTTTASYGYDPTGNTTRRPGASGGQALEWDAEGLLSTVTENGKTTSYVYDAEGNQIIRHDPDGSTLFVGDNELHVDANGAVTSVRYYSFSGQTVAVRSSNGKLSWLGLDQHGTAQLAVDADTQAVQRDRSTPFGEARGAAPPSWPSTKGFVGGSEEGSTGLTHLGAREYDQSTGRFISVDPVINYTDPQQTNGYAYANNSPVTFSDPDGQRFVVTYVPAVKVEVQTVITKKTKRVTTWVDQLVPPWVKNIFSTFTKWVHDKIQVVKTIIFTVVEHIRKVIHTLKRVVHEIKEQVRKTVKQVVNTVQRVVQGAIKGAQDFLGKVQKGLPEIRHRLANLAQHLGDTISAESSQFGLLGLGLMMVGFTAPLGAALGIASSALSAGAFVLHGIALLGGADHANWLSLLWDAAGVATLGFSAAGKLGLDVGEALARTIVFGSAAPVLKTFDPVANTWMWIPHTWPALGFAFLTVLGCTLCLLMIPVGNVIGDRSSYE